MQTGDVILVHRHTVGEDLVRWGEEIELARKGERWPIYPVYSHAAVYVGDGLIVEALGRGTTLSQLDKYIGKADVWTGYVSNTHRELMRLYALRLVEHKVRYSWWLDVLLALRMLIGLRVRWIQRDADNCSALVFDVWWSIHRRIAASRACSPLDIAMWGYLRFEGDLTEVA